MAQSQTEDGEEEQFKSTAMDKIRSHLESNRSVAERMGLDVEESVDDVLSDDNVRDVDIRARKFENPRVTVWLSECPTWANDSWDDIIYPLGLNAYNGKTRATFDVRPF